MRKSLLGLTLLFLVFSCKKDEDRVAPEIEIISPVDNTIIQVPDTVIVEARVSDNERLSFVNFGLIDEDLNQVGTRVSIGNPSNPEVVNLTLEIVDIDIENGVHYLEVFASDGINDSREFVEVNVNGIPKEFLGVGCKDESTGANQYSYIPFDGTGAISFPTDNSNEQVYTVSGRENIFVLANSNSNTLSAFDLTTSDLIWTEAVADLFGSSFVEVNYDSYLDQFYCLTNVPSILTVTKEGNLIASNEIDANSASSFITGESYHWVLEHSNGINRLSKRVKSSGFRIDSFILDYSPIRIERFSDHEFILIDSEGDVHILDAQSGFQTFVNGELAQVIGDIQVIGNRAYMATSEAVFQFNPTNLQVQEIYSTSNLIGITKDLVNSRIILSYSGELKLFGALPWQEQGTVSTGAIQASGLSGVCNK